VQLEIPPDEEDEDITRRMKSSVLTREGRDKTMYRDRPFISTSRAIQMHLPNAFRCPMVFPTKVYS
jgi:hypothetical protein